MRKIKLYKSTIIAVVTVLLININQIQVLALSKKDNSEVDRNSYDFTFIIESDTQYYNEDTKDNPKILGKYEHQINMHEWVIENQLKMNIKYVFHDGDIVDNSDMISQWENADKAFKKLDEAGIPYGVLAGNHDVYQKKKDYSTYSQYFGENRFINKPWYGGGYKDNRGHYDLISACGVDFLMMYVGWGIEKEEIKWMNDILNKYPERKAILNFHEYLLSNGDLGEEAQKIFNEVIAKNKNVFMVLSGHYHNAQIKISELDDNFDGIKDRTVYQMLFDYQSLPEGGMGYLRLMHFDLKGDRILIRTYSPSLNDYNAKDTIECRESILGEESFEIPFINK